MKILRIDHETRVEEILDIIEREIIQQQIKFTILSVEENILDSHKRWIIQRIKEHFDIFILLKTHIPTNKKDVEAYLSYGIHGVYFDEKSKGYDKKQMDMIEFAVDIFPNHLVFVGVEGNEASIEALLDVGVIPIVSSEDKDSIRFIMEHEKFHGGTSSILRYIPLLGQNPCSYRVLDRIKMKMMLETINLRQKLMVKNVEESFNSSGL